MATQNMRLKKWIKEYGLVTSFNYIIIHDDSREPMGLRDSAIINHRLTMEVMELLGDSEHGRYIQSIDEINSDIVSISDVKEGIMYSWIFPGAAIKIYENEVTDVIEDGLSWVGLRYKHVGCWGKTDVQ